MRPWWNDRGVQTPGCFTARVRWLTAPANPALAAEECTTTTTELRIADQRDTTGV